MTFNYFLNKELKDVRKQIAVLPSAGGDLAGALISEDEGLRAFFMYFVADSSMIIYTVPEFQKAGFVTYELEGPSVQKGNLLNAVDDAVLIQIAERLSAAVSDDSVQTVAAAIDENSDVALQEFGKAVDVGKDNLFNIFINANTNNSIMLKTDSYTFNLKYFEDNVTGLKHVDVFVGNCKKPLISMAYYLESQIATRTFKGESLSDTTANNILALFPND